MKERHVSAPEKEILFLQILHFNVCSVNICVVFAVESFVQTVTRFLIGSHF